MGHGGLVDHDLLEAALEGGVLLEVLAVLVERGGADGLQLAASQHGLEDRRRVDGALGGTGTHEGVELVDEQDDVAAGADLLEDLLEALLEVAPVARAGHQRTEVERVELLALERLGHVVGHDLLGEALDDGGLADAGLADEDGVVLLPAREHLHDPLDLLGTPDHRVELLLAGLLGEVAAELVEHERPGGLLRAGRAAGTGGLAGLLGGAAGALVAREQLDDLLADPGQVGAELHEHLGRHALALTDEAEEDVLGADVVVPQLERLAQRQLQDLLGAWGEGDVPGWRRAALADDLLDLAAHGLERDAERLEGLGGDPFTFVDQPEQDVLGTDVVVVEEPSFLLSEHDDPSSPVGEPFEQCEPPALFGGIVGPSVPAASAKPRGHPTPGSSLSGSARPVLGVSGSSGFRGRRGLTYPQVVPAESPLQQLPGMARHRQRVEAALRAAVAAEDELMAQMGGHLITAGGKRARPLFAVASAAALAEDAAGVEAAVTDEVILGGVAVELVQVGSLCHDDVIDEAETRRGVQSVNARWGNLKAILAGDFLLAKASEIAAGLGTEVAGLLAATIGRLCEGEVHELRRAYDADRTEASYLAAIEGKTAALFATACRVGGIVGGLPRACIDQLSEFGRSYGMAFQIVDDVLDVIATDEQLGKPAGHDLAEGIYNLPVIRALAGGASDLRPLLGRPVADRELDIARKLVRESDGVEESIEVARGYVSRAVEALAPIGDRPATAALAGAAEHLLVDAEALAGA